MFVITVLLYGTPERALLEPSVSRGPLEGGYLAVSAVFGCDLGRADEVGVEFEQVRGRDPAFPNLGRKAGNPSLG
jgi:hypothetical protein